MKNGKKLIMTYDELNDELNSRLTDLQVKEIIEKSPKTNRRESARKAWIKRREKYGENGISEKGVNNIKMATKELREVREYLKKRYENHFKK